MTASIPYTRQISGAPLALTKFIAQKVSKMHFFLSIRFIFKKFFKAEIALAARYRYSVMIEREYGKSKDISDMSNK